MNKINYQKIMDKTLSDLQLNNKIPDLLLHSCCGPCSSYVLEYLSKYFKISIIFANDNIFPEEEYNHRLNEQIRLLDEMQFENPVTIFPILYSHENFRNVTTGLESEPEGGLRCIPCFRQRMEICAKIAKNNNFDYFTTTLSVSPHKNSMILNDIGQELSEKYDIPFLFADFKKREGYKRSVSLANEFKLYRQNYCGCEFSLAESKKEQDA